MHVLHELHYTFLSSLPVHVLCMIYIHMRIYTCVCVCVTA
jgi:hypothetical protein